MTDAPAAIKGCFADFKTVKTRKLCQLVIEIPIEEADAALAALGGVPRPDAERWVAVARLDFEKAPVATADPKERRPFHELPMSQQAGIMAEDYNFQKFMRAENNIECASLIRTYCQVDSRSKIVPESKAAERWISLLREFGGIK